MIAGTRVVAKKTRDASASAAGHERLVAPVPDAVVGVGPELVAPVADASVAAREVDLVAPVPDAPVVGPRLVAPIPDAVVVLPARDANGAAVRLRAARDGGAARERARGRLRGDRRDGRGEDEHLDAGVARVVRGAAGVCGKSAAAVTRRCRRPTCREREPRTSREFPNREGAPDLVARVDSLLVSTPVKRDRERTRIVPINSALVTPPP